MRSGEYIVQSAFPVVMAFACHVSSRPVQPACSRRCYTTVMMVRSLLSETATTKPAPFAPHSAIVDREPLALPNGKWVAVWVIVNIENWDIEKPIPRTVLSPPGNQVHVPDIPNWSWQEYGMRVGFRRLNEALVSRRIPVTMSVNGSVCVQYPRIAGAAEGRGLGVSRFREGAGLVSSDGRGIVPSLGAGVMPRFERNTLSLRGAFLPPA